MPRAARKRKSAYIYVSELKKFAKKKGVKVSQKYIDALNASVEKILEMSVAKCNKMKNKTLLPKHLPEAAKFDELVKAFEDFNKTITKILKK
ncbi:MAG: hypothetical protein ACP6IS_02465 [Candidatus Asgardarchaeia archaeon]